MVFIASKPESIIGDMDQWTRVLVSDGSRVAGVLPAEFYGQTLGGIPGPTFRSRAHFEAADLPDDVELWWVNHRGTELAYRRSQECDAIVSKNGVRGAPAASITPDHWGAQANGLVSDRNAIQAAINWANYLTEKAGFAHQVVLNEGRYTILSSDAHLSTAQSLILRGAGRDASRIKRFDYIGWSGGSRKDIFRHQPAPGSGQTLEIHGIGFESDLMDPHPGGKGPTVAYRFAGRREWEGFVLGGTETTIILPPAAQLPLDQTYVGDVVQIDGGPGLGSERTITGYDHGTNTITVGTAFNFMTSGDPGTWPTVLTYVQIGTVAPGIGLLVQGLARFVVRDCAFTGIRNQVINHTACRFVDITGNHFRYYTRGGISGRRCEIANYSGNLFEFGSDDAIFNSNALDGWEGTALSTICTGNVLRDAQGFRFIGARHLQVTNNLITRPITIGVCIGPSGRETPVNQHGITIRNNTVIDLVNRNALAFDLEGGMFAGIRVASTSGVVEVDSLGAETTITNFKVPGTVESGAVILPGSNIWTTDADGASDYFQPTIGVDVSDNSVLTTFEPGQKVSDRNGKGTWYYKGTLRTGGFVDDTLTAADLAVTGLQFLGPFQDMTVIGNNLSTRGMPSIQFTNGRFGGNPHPTAGYRYLQVARIDFDRALTGILVKDNRLNRNSAGVAINHQSRVSNYIYDVEIDGNRIDCDPYFESPLRTLVGGLPTGAWDSPNQWAIDINRCEGISITRNEFSNCARPWRGPVTTHLDGNTIYARAVAVGDDPANRGVRVIPAPGLSWRVIDMDSDPASATYGRPGRTLLDSATMPTNGQYVAGHFVRCSDPGTGYLGWLRLTTGNNHVDGTDWRIVYADPARSLEDGSESDPSLAFAFDYNTGLYHPGSNEIAIVTDGQEILRATSTHVIAPKGLLTLSGHTVGALTATIVDDSVATFAVPTGRTSGFALISGPGSLGRHALIAFNASSLAIEKSTGFSTVGLAVDVSTSDVTGTTGADGKMTVAVQTGVIKIENRLGSSGTFSVFFL